MTSLLNKSTWFPDPELADAEGLVAMGGDLGAHRLLAAYGKGIFPWTADPVTWWSPDPRAIFELDRFHVPRSLDRVLRKGVFEVSLDRAFGEVMEGCAMPAPGRDETWVTSEFIEAYTRMHQLGHAHSVECWQRGELAGGIYGVSIGGFFAGESMFHRVNDASKVALYHLVRHLRERSFTLFDIQMVTPATKPFGAIEIPRSEYLKRLTKAVEMKCSF